MTDHAAALTALDTVLRTHAERLVDDGEVITNWVVLIATRTRWLAHQAPRPGRRGTVREGR